ncbi:thrombomodulin [Sorex araneus]|uniref:thrombomodulin n=1 Tax=Sorex araneus TaxID=42254 RepID=UPI0003314912|nr:thrombomodulin [Sorex araneus]
MLVLLLGVLAPAGWGLPAPTEPPPHGSQCVEHDCFALFRHPESFAAASLSCKRRHGHLMTVRSSVAADVISLLLGGDGGVGLKLWIGLELPPNCSDVAPLGPLRGFRWVTGDNSTSYSRWARVADEAPLCGPLCVAVSAAAGAGELAWETQRCNATADGFLCEFPFAASCRPLPVEAAAANVSITYSTPFGARGPDFQTLPEGSIATVEPSALQLVCRASPGEGEARWGREVPGAWVCSVDNGGCEHACTLSAGAPRCVCAADTVLQPDGRSCAARDDHACHRLCEQFCVLSTDAPGEYSCMCATGYRLAADQHRCEDVDDCLLEPSPCKQRCVNTQGGFECHCFPGYEMLDGECVELLDPCFGNDCEYQCQPIGETDFRCICAEGFAPDPKDPHKCLMFCNKTVCEADCDPNSPGVCRCPEGYILDEDSMCADIDECASNECTGACRNLPGSFECLCGPETALAGQVATDCDPVKVNEDAGSGEPPISPTPSATSRPSPAGPMHSGVLIGISIASLSLVVALLALLCHLRKKQGTSPAELEYKCGSPAKEVVLQQVRTDLTAQKL